jgi:hypothetical protein
MELIINKLLLLLALTLTYSWGANASGLPPEHEAARLMLALESSVNDQLWEKAQIQIDALSKLEIELPLASFYFKGVVNIQQNNYSLAQKSLEQYVVKAGRDGSHYKDALQLITQAGEQQTHNQESVNVQQKPSLTLADDGSRDGYVKSLQALYLTDSPIDALVMQLNSLLSVHPYTGSRIKKVGVKEGLIYRISVESYSLMLQEKNYLSGSPVLTATTLPIPGVDPFIRYGCSNKEYACWLFQPASDHRRWIQIDYDEMVVKELAQAMTKLIKAIQLKL